MGSKRSEGEPVRWLALLRAVNVGGTGVVRMVDLRASLESLGLGDVSTHIQSGNVFFTSSEREPGSLARTIEHHLERDLGIKTTALLLKLPDLERAAAANPFASAADEDILCHMMFLDRAPDAAHRQRLMTMQGDDYRLHVQGAVLYFAYARNLAGRRRAIDFERVLGVRGTARSCKVVDALIALLRDAGASAPATRPPVRDGPARGREAASARGSPSAARRRR